MKLDLSILLAVPILFYLIPYLIELNNIVATFVALALGIWITGYVIYVIALFLGAIAMKIENKNDNS